MIVIPSLRTVILQPPKTASTSLRVAIESRHKDARALYRHMERDGLPAEFADWHIVGICREPLARLRSIWAWMRSREGEHPSDPGFFEEIRKAAAAPFEEWLLESQDTFHRNTLANGTPQKPPYLVRHLEPIARKSQWRTLRPDLGPIEILPMESLPEIEARFDITISHLNASPVEREDHAPSTAVMEHLIRWHAWDLSLYEREPVTEMTFT